MTIGKQGKGKGRTRASWMCTPISRAEKIQDVRNTIKCNNWLIHYYQLLLDNAPENHLSFQAYLREIDERGNAIKEERKRLIDAYTRGANGEIPALEKANEELEEKLKTLHSELSPAQQAAQREKKVARITVKAKSLRERLAQLDRELKDENFDVEELLDDL